MAGGQSGGIAVTLAGDVVGLTGNRITEAQYGLESLRPPTVLRVSRRCRPRPTPQPGVARTRRKPTTGTSSACTTSTRRACSWLIWPGTELEVSVDGVGDAMLVLIAPVTEESVLADGTTAASSRIPVHRRACRPSLPAAGAQQRR